MRLLRGALRLWFRLEVIGAEHLRTTGPVLFVSNHASLIDGALLSAVIPRSCRVVLHGDTAGTRLPPLLRAPQAFDAVDLSEEGAARRLVRELRDGEAALVFPEGRPSARGGLMKVHSEAARLVEAAGVPVVPIHLEGPELLPFTGRQGGTPVRWRPRVRIHVGAPRRLDVDHNLKGAERAAAATAALLDLLEGQRFAALDRHETVSKALADTARRLGTGDTAIEDALGNRLSLRRIAVGAAALGPRLRARTEPGEVVGLLLPGIATAPIVLDALWRERRVPAMLNPTLGTGPGIAALQAAGVHKVVSSRAFVEQAGLDEIVTAFDADGIEVHWTEDIRSEIGPLRRVRALLAGYLGRAPDVSRDTPAVVLFTSGTEGLPKGVVLSHGNLLANVAQLRARTDVGPADRVLNALPLFHSLGLTAGLLFPLICGARIFIYPTPLHYKVIPELAYRFQPTLIFGTDTFFGGWGRRADPHDFASVRAAIAGAEPVKPSTRALWVERFGVRILEGYGATETSPVLAINTPASDRFGTVGRFLPAIETRLEPVPGIPGARLWVRGPNVMKGYLRADRPGELQPPKDDWYDTGDAVSIDPEGFVTLSGRIKRFAKIGGEMVSLAAVERLAAATWPEAAIGAVTAPDPRKGERIVLAVAGADADKGALAARARAEGVSELHLPAEVRNVDEIPLLASGKVNYPELARRLLGARSEAAA